MPIFDPQEDEDWEKLEEKIAEEELKILEETEEEE
jgi:hypothetical protein